MVQTSRSASARQNARPNASSKTPSKTSVSRPKANTLQNKTEKRNIVNGVQRDHEVCKEKKILKKPGGIVQKYLDYIKIDKIGKTIEDSIPINGISQSGVIETKPGNFTKSYRLKDINFKVAPNEQQGEIFRSYMDLMNSMSIDMRWQITIFNHERAKREVVDDIRIMPQHDGLNSYRNELNSILLANLAEGRNTLQQEKFLTVSIEDDDAERAIESLQRTDSVIDMRLRKITKVHTSPMTTGDRLRVLYSMYNIQGDYRKATDLYDISKGNILLKELYAQGLNYKDLIAPYSLSFSKSSYFQIDDLYGEALFIKKVPPSLTTNFLNDLSDIQQNMIISITNETIDHTAALKIAKKRLANINRDANHFYNQGSGLGLPPDIQLNQTAAEGIIEDLQVNDQNMYFVTIVVVVFSEDKESLRQDIKYIENIAGRHDIHLIPLREQQEQGFNTALPLCRNDLNTQIMLTTESASVFLPFNSEELNQRHAVFYGLNQTSRNMIRYDRTTGDNYNELIFGTSGSGKSFIAKFEMIQTLLVRPDSQVYVIDPQGEYYPLTKALHGSRIELAQGKPNYINPMDMEITDDPNDDTNPIAFKASQILSMIEIMLNSSGGIGNTTMDPTYITIIDQVIRKLYKKYIIRLKNDGKTYEPEIAPTLNDLTEELKRRDEPQAHKMAAAIGAYTNGSFDTFAHRTNVGEYMNKRFVVYDIKSLGTGMNKLGLHICMNNVWNQMIINSKKQIFTYFYIDEFHLLLDSEVTLQFVKRIWKMARKWKGCPCGITQNSDDLLRNKDSKEISDLTSVVIMLKAARTDRINFQTLFNVSDAQIEYITNSNPGEGLIYNSKVIIPFALTVPKDTQLYRIMTTRGDVAGAFC